MRTMSAGEFKDACLAALDEVAETRGEVVITKRGRPVAKLVPYVAQTSGKTLEGSVTEETGDPYSTGETWDIDSA